MANIIYRSENIQIIFLWEEKKKKKKQTSTALPRNSHTDQILFIVQQYNTENEMAPDLYVYVWVCVGEKKNRG